MAPLISPPNPAQRLWNWWKRTAKKIGNFQARVLLMLFYFVVVCPFALVVRWKSDPLAINPGTGRGWLPRRSEEGTPLERARRQH